MEENKLPTQLETNSEIVVSVPKRTRAKRTVPLEPLTPIQKDLPKELSTEDLRRQKREEARLRLRREWEVESKMVTGIFRDLEVGAGGNLRFSARKYPWDQIENYDFKDGQTYTVPLWVARHLNENCKWPVYRHNIDPNAKEGEKAKQYVNQFNHRFAFVSSDFTGLAKAEGPSIIMVGK